MKPNPSQPHVQKASLSSPNVLPSRGRSKVSLNGLSSTETRAIVKRYSSIVQRAYQLYEAQGHQHGHALEYWLTAEREILLR